MWKLTRVGLIFVAGLAGLAAVGAGEAAAQTAAEQEVIDTVQRLFDAMAAANADAIRELVVSDGRVLAMRGGVSAGTPGSTSLGEFADAISAAEGQLLERMWNPAVSVDGAVAALWTRYDFHLDGEFSHCGTDHVSLVRTDSGWKVAGITYTVQREGCEPSPLGPPQ